MTLVDSLIARVRRLLRNDPRIDDSYVKLLRQLHRIWREKSCNWLPSVSDDYQLKILLDAVLAVRDGRGRGRRRYQPDRDALDQTIHLATYLLGVMIIRRAPHNRRTNLKRIFTRSFRPPNTTRLVEVASRLDRNGYRHDEKKECEKKEELNDEFAAEAKSTSGMIWLIDGVHARSSIAVLRATKKPRRLAVVNRCPLTCLLIWYHQLLAIGRSSWIFCGQFSDLLCRARKPIPAFSCWWQLQRVSLVYYDGCGSFETADFRKTITSGVLADHCRYWFTMANRSVTLGPVERRCEMILQTLPAGGYDHIAARTSLFALPPDSGDPGRYDFPHLAVGSAPREGVSMRSVRVYKLTLQPPDPAAVLHWLRGFRSETPIDLRRRLLFTLLIVSTAQTVVGRLKEIAGARLIFYDADGSEPRWKVSTGRRPFWFTYTSVGPGADERPIDSELGDTVRRLVGESRPPQKLFTDPSELYRQTVIDFLRGR